MAEYINMMQWQETYFSDPGADEEMGELFDFPAQGENELESTMNWITCGTIGALVDKELVTKQWNVFLPECLQSPKFRAVKFSARSAKGSEVKVFLSKTEECGNDPEDQDIYSEDKF
ncbi:hypothetical protein IFR05_008253 [Cadophora sp. M221]|nr:hypothetical protein IFR05_008253 [Cadophora sp. M221]